MSLCDLEPALLRRRMLPFLEARIQRSDFEEMRRHGVAVVRVPSGYWHWVAYAEGEGPWVQIVESRYL